MTHSKIHSPNSHSPHEGSQGLLLLNLGTPDAPDPESVRRYLAEFLMDPRVIDIPYLARLALVKGIILRTRPKRSAEAYEKIWTPEGSPLAVYSQALAQKVAAQMGTLPVEFGMRYGNPSIESALRRLIEKGAKKITVFPLYPQYATASTESTRDEVERVREKFSRSDATRFEARYIGAFYDHPDFIESFRQVARPVLDSFKPEHLLLSFHGLPERQIRKSAAAATGERRSTACQFSDACCGGLTPSHSVFNVPAHCYRAQSYATARALVLALNWDPQHASVCFQSRLGVTAWIKPYTDEVLADLAKRGVKRVAVMCPAFVADCLETLEEISMRAREQFQELGGEDLILVPSLNAQDHWVKTVVTLSNLL